MNDKQWDKLMKLGKLSGCHQLPERSFFIGKYQMPVCARCTGVFVGQIFAVICLARREKMSLFSMMMLIAVLGVDWFAQEADISESTNTRRFISGICGGLGLTYLCSLFVNKAIGYFEKSQND